MPSVTARRTATGVAATVAGLAAAAAARRARSAGAADPELDEPLGTIQGREHAVTADDGVRIHVEEHGPEDAELTVVLAHGYTLSSRCWHYQVRDLAERVPHTVRVVTYDQRGHGRSDAAPDGSATIHQLGRDLHAVLEQRVPDGPVVLGGHSMGGMTLMSLAEHRPELFGDRVAGVALVATSPGGLADLTFGMPKPVARIGRKVLPTLMARQAAAEASGKRVRPPSPGGTRRLLFGPSASPAHVRFTTELTAQTKAATTAAFFATFEDHDRRAALSAFKDIPVIIFVGTRDLLCPESHSREMAQLLPHSELVVYPGAGHMVLLERHEDVTARLARFSADALRRAGTRQLAAG